MMVLTTAPRLDASELASSGVAVAVSSCLYVRFGHPYLARGVLGDLVGLAALAVPLGTARRRVRHEALWCLAGIGTVHIAAPQWPLAIGDSSWWTAIVVALAGYLTGRHWALR